MGMMGLATIVAMLLTLTVLTQAEHPSAEYHRRNFGQRCDGRWKAHNGNGCEKYGERNWCKTNGNHYGSNWNHKKWKTFEHWADSEGRTALICPQCGCEEHRFRDDGSGLWISCQDPRGIYKCVVNWPEKDCNKDKEKHDYLNKCFGNAIGSSLYIFDHVKAFGKEMYGLNWCCAMYPDNWPQGDN